MQFSDVQAMAAPGMGDVLTGLIAGILGQCRDPWLAACAGVMAHAIAGDELARERHRGILDSQQREVIAAYRGQGLQLIRAYRRGKWVMLQWARRNQERPAEAK